MTENDIFCFSPGSSESRDFEPLVFGVTGLAHSHIYGMCDGLIKAGAALKCVYDKDEAAVISFKNKYHYVGICSSEDELLEDTEIKLVACAGIPSERAGTGVRAMTAGKDFFTDKAPVVSLSQLEEIKKTVCRTGARYFVYYGESIDNESAVMARRIIKNGVIGKVFHIDSLAPHRLNPENRPEWFFKKEFTGGILTDLGSHQTQQFLSYTGNSDAVIDFARVHNYNFRKYPEFEDYGDFALTGENGVTGYFRIDWNSPDGLGTWGDARMIIEGSEGYIELRKNCDIGADMSPNRVIVVNSSGIFAENVTGKVGITYFNDLIYDCNMRTETAMAQSEAFKAIELAITAQNFADKRLRSCRL